LAAAADAAVKIQWDLTMCVTMSGNCQIPQCWLAMTQVP